MGAGRLYLFGRYCLDRETRTLLREGSVVPVPPKAVDTLLVLIGNRGRVVEKEKLIQAVWPDTFVEESSLTQHISLLRKALGETAGGQSYIETIPKRGYRFVGDVKEECEEADGRADLAGHSRRWGLWAVALLALMAGAAAVWSRFGYHIAGPPAEFARTVLLTSFSICAGPPAFSPAGNQVAFSWDGARPDGPSHIYVKSVRAEGTPLQLTAGAWSDFSPAWAPDGGLIAFLRAVRGGQAAVIVIPALGGPERRLGEVYWTGSELSPPYLAWSPDSKQLIVVDRCAPEEPTGLFLLSIDTGEKRSLFSPPSGSIGDGSPALSPDGRSLAFTRSLSYTVSEIYLLNLSPDLKPEAEPTRLTFDNRRCSGFAWTPDGREIVYSSNRLGSFRLWSVAVSAPGRPQLLASVGEEARTPAIARAGPTGPSRLAYTRNHWDRNIWRFAVPGNGSKVSRPVKLVASTRDDVCPQYSPDGRKIAFASDRSGSYEIWVCESDGTCARQLTSFSGPVTDLPHWSPDGRRIAFHSRPEGRAQIYLVNAEAGAPQRLTNDQADDVAPSWSRDGKWIYFGSNRTGSHQVWKMPAEGGAAIQVTRNGGIFALESPDGKFVYYTKVRGLTSLWRMPAGGGPETQIVESLFYLLFAVGSDGIYFIRAAGVATPEREIVPPSIHFFSFARRMVTKIAQMERGDATTMTVSPDGRSILYSRDDDTGSELMLLDNFR